MLYFIARIFVRRNNRVFSLVGADCSNCLEGFYAFKYNMPIEIRDKATNVPLLLCNLGCPECWL